ncbi:transient receptor potential-gamma protein-like isoform X2 [Stegodyphus dumicola]|uniref:transient receptor potential-gamma protein-like isoform X2 n=1 Tax=Stegodyphus dumicola TaxID=202533 RepID=UPI0015A7A75C|nr:transient receptor potential-gamma protein-like isoform X2 [Stegodyphus dumicola]
MSPTAPPTFAANNMSRPDAKEGALTLEEKRFLVAVERGDLASTRRYLESAKEKNININCTDPLGRSALLMAIDNENLEMVQLLIYSQVETKDALLHAINEEFVEAVELLLEHEEQHHVKGKPHSWEAIDRDKATFTSDITPLILAAHRDNYEIIKLLLDRVSNDSSQAPLDIKIPTPHEVRCGCVECVKSSSEDSLRHSRSRINSYRALASPSLIALSSKDPILSAFELSWELRRLSFMEQEFKNEYQELRRQCQNFATALLDHTRSSYELEAMLNYDPSGPAFEHGDRMHLSRLKLAIKYKQKKFCAHPNVQQLLASIWYEGLPGFRRKNILLQMAEITRIGLMFPVFCTAYIIAPKSYLGRTLRKPFIKFICHSASYVTFLFLLILASQRIETVVVEWFGTDEMRQRLHSDVTTKRGAPPSVVELIILTWVMGLIWSEIKQLWDSGPLQYINDMWNIIDFITNSLYVATVALRIIAYFQVQKEIAEDTGTAYLPREKWDAWDPILIAEGLFATANIFSSLKLVYIFSVNPYLGPLQICLGRMVIDIIKFFFVYTLVLFAFACGMNQLLWYYADMERQVCFSGKNGQDSKLDHSACFTWRRFSNLFESSQTLFWASFGLIDLDNFELTGIQSYTRFWGLLMFGSYCVINVVVLLNLLIAMMNHSYQIISEHADVEWKFARTKLWLSYFEDGATVPPPFNIIPTPKSAMYLFRWLKRKFCATRTVKKKDLKTIRRKAKQASERDLRYKKIMRNLVRRYVTKEQRNADNQGVTEDDVNEIKQDISAFRFELIEIMKNSGFNTSSASDQMQGGLAKGTGGKKGRQKERRLMKGFDIGVVKQPPNKANQKSDVEAATKSPRTHWLKLANLANGRKQAKRPQGAKWPYSERNSRNSKSKNQDSLRSQSMESVSSEVTSEAEATHNDTTSSESSLSLTALVSGDPLSEAGSNNGVTIVVSDDESMKCDRATNTDTPARQWSKLTKKLNALTSLTSSRFRMAFHDASPEKDPQMDHHHTAKLHHSEATKKAKARRTVSAPAPSAHPKHHPLVMRPQGKTPYASIPSVSVSVQNNAHNISTLSGNIGSVEESPSSGKSTLNSPSSPKTPKMRLQERFPVPTVHIEEEVPVKGTSSKRASSRRSSTITRKDSDIPIASSTPENTTPTVPIAPQNQPATPIATSQPVSPHKPSNGTLGLISTVYGIEPVNKEMRTGWI